LGFTHHGQRSQVIEQFGRLIFKAAVIMGTDKEMNVARFAPPIVKELEQIAFSIPHGDQLGLGNPLGDLGQVFNRA
jgi:hypothetical protein